jgi:putative transposase
MTDDRMALVDLLQKSGDGDFLRAVAEVALQILQRDHDRGQAAD